MRRKEEIGRKVDRKGGEGKEGREREEEEDGRRVDWRRGRREEKSR